ncbi:MAG: hypothetical protein KDK33_18080, partial [Leptospiraceae bacterium]|nr:hypothetical protein [Leptospiraceae bacterium]
ADRFAADYRPLLFDASYFGYLDELDRNGSARNRIRYIVSGTFTAGEGSITIEYSLRDRFTGKELYSGRSTATGEDALHRAALQVAERIERLTPVRGEVVKVNDGFVYIHAGKRDGVEKGQVFILENDPSKEFQVVELDTSFAALKPGKDVPLISAGMVLLSNPRMLR